MSQSYGVNVMDYGAVGDGVTDDATAIQAVIDATPGGRIYFPTTCTPPTMPDGSLGVAVPSYYCSRTLRVTAPGTQLCGEAASIRGGTVIRFAKGVTGIDLHGPGLNAAIADLTLWGQSPWDQVHPSQGVLPAGFTGNANVDAVAPSDDGVRVGTDLCILRNVVAMYFGRHGFNLSNAQNGSGAKSNAVVMEYCYAMNNRGYGAYVQGGESNAGVFTGFRATANQLGGINDQSFLGSTWVGLKTDENRFDNGTNTGRIPTSQLLVMIIRLGGVVTLQFTSPYKWNDGAGGAFTVGQGITVVVPGDTSFSGTFIVSGVAGNAVSYYQTGADGSANIIGATAKLATMTDAWGAARVPQGGAVITSNSSTSRTVLVNPYLEGGQYAQLGTTTFVLGGIIGATLDFAYGTPAILSALVPGTAQLGYYGLFPSVVAPADRTSQFSEQVGTAADQMTIRTRNSALRAVAGHARTVFSEMEGPAGYQYFSNSPNEASAVARLWIAMTRDANGYMVGGATHINSQGTDPVTVNMHSGTPYPCGTGGLQVGGPLSVYVTGVGGGQRWTTDAGRPRTLGAAPKWISGGSWLGGLSIAGTDVNGVVTFTPAIDAYNSILLTVVFATPWAMAPKTVMLTAASPGAAMAMATLYVSSVTATGFAIAVGPTPIAAGEQCAVMYHVTG